MVTAKTRLQVRPLLTMLSMDRCVLACKQVLDRAHLLYSNVLVTARQNGLMGHSHFPAGVGLLDRKRRVTEGLEAGDSHFSFIFRELVLRCHAHSSAVENEMQNPESPNRPPTVEGWVVHVSSQSAGTIESIKNDSYSYF